MEEENEDDDGEIGEEAAGPTIRDDDGMMTTTIVILTTNGEEAARRRKTMMRRKRMLLFARRSDGSCTGETRNLCPHHQPVQNSEKIRANVDILGAGEEYPRQGKKYEELREQLTAEVESVQFTPGQDQFLVDNLYAFNRRRLPLGGQMLRLAERPQSQTDRLPQSLYPVMGMDDTWYEDNAKEWAAFMARMKPTLLSAFANR
jgi:RNA polymerase primary sigma factor